MESDQYMPEYWSANKIIGKLEKALINAENILGLIQSKQIASLEAGKVTGLITSAQIKEVEAAKLAGQLTSAQIKEIEAAKIAGQLSSSQLAVNSVTAEKIAALAVTAGKLASESVTTEKLAANSITAAKIVAGTITAEKLAVVELSAISANLGTVTAGILSGVTFQTTKKDLVINASGITLAPGETNVHRITWEEEAKQVAYLFANKPSKTQNVLFMRATEPEKEGSAGLTFEATPTVGAVAVNVGAAGVSIQRTLLTNKEESSFILNPKGATSKRSIDRGTAIVEWPGGAIESKTVEVAHELGVTPTIVILTPIYVLATRRMSPQLVSTSSTKIALNSACNDAVPAAGVKQTINWLAMT